MQLFDLPDDVLRMVLRKSRTGATSRGSLIKRNLPLLAVCRRWRALALPVVFGNMSVKYVEDWRHVCPSLDNAQTRHGRVETDMAPIAPAGYAQMVRRLEISVCSFADSIVGLEAVLDAMAETADTWRGVRQLCVSVRQGVHRPCAAGTGPADYRDAVRRVCSRLAAMLPGVRRLVCEGEHRDAIVEMLYGRIAGCYAGRLQRLHSSSPATAPRDALFTRLVDLRIGRYSGADPRQLLRVCPDALERLSLPDLESSHAWASFCADGGAQVIRFPNLRTLDVSYRFECVAGGGREQRQGAPAWQLHFPKLRTMSVDCPWGTCPLLRDAVLPSHMDAVTLKLTSSALCSIGSTAMPAARCLKLVVQRGSYGGPAAMVAANRLLESAQGSGEVELSTLESLDCVLPDVITCASLTRLWVAAPTGVDAMLGLVRGLPNLAYLGLQHLEAEDVQSDIPVPAPDDQRPVEPLSTSIRSMYVNTYGDRATQGAIVQAIRHVLLGLPALRALSARNLPSKPIAEFVCAYSARFPRLASVRLDICER
ncbi:hypothetical protein H4R18_004094 [Coemansia javaensis]|uniref:F-box domain-containing protein n=1 Tax=Coemansia javaensis TaxID=2761396 RepID=A0A9W8LGQ5_9FUNG|nr:hypothetical protein H4R18_004094 [Coemansia javaensis]